jgi:ABC-type glycerol-3-phosphate transport system substrate-binding protein
VTAGEPEAAVDLVTRLSGRRAHELDATSGTIPARADAFAAVEPLDATDERRLAVLRRTVAEGMITFPPEPRFPLVEDAGWGAIHECLKGRLGVPEAVAAMQRAAEAVLG